MTHASVFSGIGGPEVAATMLGWDNLFHCEINPFGKRVLDYWYPNAKSYDDITTTDFSEWRGKVNVLTGGFPCQPFSYAGKRRGANDDRYLWPYMFKCIDQIRPDWVVAENVGGILTMVEQGEVTQLEDAPTLFDEDNSVHRYEYRGTFTLERICRDLETHGYDVQPILIPACAVGAPHRRDRVFIVARRIASDSDNRTDRRTAGEDEGKGGEERIQERHEVRKPDEPNQVRREGERTTGNAAEYRHAADTINEGLQGRHDCDTKGHGQSSDGCTGFMREISRGEKPTAYTEDISQGQLSELGRGINGTTGASQFGRRDCEGRTEYQVGQRWANFPSVSPVHRGNDGLPFNVDDLTISFGKWRTEALKAYGNAIVPQVMYEIFRAIEQVQQQTLF